MCRTGTGIQYYEDTHISTGALVTVALATGILDDIAYGELSRLAEMFGLKPKDINYVDGMRNHLVYWDEKSDEWYINGNLDDIDEIEEQKNKENKYMLQNDRNWSTIGILKRNPVKTAIDHEYGRMLVKKLPKNELREWSQVVRDSIRSGWKPPTDTSMRNYEQMFAEAFALKINRHEEYLSREVNSFINKVLERWR